MMLEPLTAPAAEPVSLSEMRAHLRLDTLEEDAPLADAIVAARAFVEARTARALIDQVFRLTLDAWPDDGVLRLPRGPVSSVTSVAVRDAEGTAQPLVPADWMLEARAHPARLWAAPGKIWPQPGQRFSGIEVTFVAGYGPEPDDVPAPLRQAVRLLAAWFFEQRVVDAPISGPVGEIVAALIAPFRLPRVFA